uniref:Uncharacterized protein n=1 Tax=Ditylenchus dipsaci TaxID=166011 RepID=A0A915EEP3_9BILA
MGKDGLITLWHIAIKERFPDFLCTRTFAYHSGATYFLALLNDNIFVSASKDGTYGVWNLDSEHYKRVLNPAREQVCPFYDCKIVGLPTDELIAIVGHNSRSIKEALIFGILKLASVFTLLWKHFSNQEGWKWLLLKVKFVMSF